MQYNALVPTTAGPRVIPSAEHAPSPGSGHGSGRGRLDKRRAILDAAAEVFGESGYERASVDAIALKAAVSKPTIYNHFGTKEQLFRESIAESAATVNQQSMDAITAFNPRSANWRAELNDLVIALTQCSRSECAQSVQRQIYSEVKRDPEVYRAVRSRAIDPITNALAGQLAMLANAGRLEIPNPLLAAKQLLALATAEIVELTELGGRTATNAEVRKAAAAAVDTFVAAFAKD